MKDLSKPSRKKKQLLEEKYGYKFTKKNLLWRQKKLEE